MAHADRLRLDQAPRLQLCVPDWVSPINPKTIEIEHPRGVSNLGQWDIGGGMGRFRGDIETCAGDDVGPGLDRQARSRNFQYVTRMNLWLAAR
ncbi:hypothetical protein EN978_16850 [Mesorhizobium sp. M7A.F.Ca.US.001.04.1.1]|nr:hypothetical protein EN990_06810 [Mesorhizobium sp. M7A.F.Ca.US.005.03.1.1]RUY17109.1 hypothetical protein EN991_08970 [Mesorhizobium sp. M7A.F.Ca.US.005.03.2.1]RUY27689.1 hypothetical protein EN979_15700 [Mesorhizobium sp. M7A.F.Ca.US.001.04.2.1]RUY40929.1 hypothetical protein EN978_16850 [Mesorhizobium sp. M7A.F.Ca.US.001.04.1.1]RVA00765.1 hypothetical protein EN932_35130 [Mesorhizobium sp. M7A.F.Ca.US.002.01.1.1]RVA01934.1 hypothetical protein EN938_20870 [Mesorhizobium sp. M7A.F.Ca.US.0